MEPIFLPWIGTTKPGRNYGLDANHRPDDVRVFFSRYDLAAHCGSRFANPTICEVGAFRGDFSQKLIEMLSPVKIYLIDVYDYVSGRFSSRPEVEIMIGKSWDMLASLSDDSLDYIYIDADHSYEAVKKDIEASHNKIKPGGIIQFNDYCTYGEDEGVTYGVLNAVNSYIENYQVKVIGLSLERSGYHDIAVQCL